MIREPGSGEKWTNYEFSLNDSMPFRELAGSGDFSQYSVFPAYCLQSLSPVNARPLLHYGDEVAGVVNEFGKGRAYLFGTLLGHAGLAYDDWRNADFLLAVLEKAGVKRDCAGRLMRRRRSLGSRAAWFIFNLTDGALEEVVPTESYSRVRDIFGDELPITSGDGPGTR